MKRFYLLASMAILFVAVGLACGSSNSSSSHPAVDDDDDNDDDAAAGCGSSANTQCAANATAALTSCDDGCQSANPSGSCAALACTWNCNLQDETAMVACFTKYDCPSSDIAQQQCLGQCAHTGISCLGSLGGCTSAQAVNCSLAFGTCSEDCLK